MPFVLGLGALLLVTLGYLVFQWLQAGQQLAAARGQLLADVLRATQARPIDSGELSRLVAQLQKLPDHESDHELTAALACIELARGRPERAQALFLAVASQPGASPAEQRLAAQILLRCHESGTADRAAATGMLQQVMAFAEAGYADGHDAPDLLTAWLASNRLPDAEREKRFGEQLRTDHTASLGARLVQCKQAFRLDMPRAELDSLRAEFDRPPAEIDAMLAALVLQQGDLPGALAIAEPALLQTPGVDSVRFAAALVFHACVSGHQDAPDERAHWVARRDAQLDWLDAHAPVDDQRRQAWATMRAVR